MQHDRERVAAIMREKQKKGTDATTKPGRCSTLRGGCRARTLTFDYSRGEEVQRKLLGFLGQLDHGSTTSLVADVPKRRVIWAWEILR